MRLFALRLVGSICTYVAIKAVLWAALSERAAQRERLRTMRSVLRPGTWVSRGSEAEN